MPLWFFPFLELFVITPSKEKIETCHYGQENKDIGPVPINLPEIECHIYG